MKFENLLVELGGFGRHQAMVILLLVIPRLTIPFHFLLNNFIAAVPSHHCDISALEAEGGLENLTREQRLTVSIPPQEDGELSSCQIFSEPQFHLLSDFSNATHLPAVPCQSGWVFDNSSFISTLATEWDLVCDQRGMTKVTATIFFVGVMVGAAVFGTLSDRYGRKRMLLFSYLLSIFFAVASAFSVNFAMFAATRFFSGVAISGISIISIVLCVEWVDIDHRTLAAVMISLDWTAGAMLLSGIAYLVNDWRYLTITVTSQLVLATLTWWWLPESARWLIANGRLDEAHYYLTRCARANNREQVMMDIKPHVLSTVIVSEDRGNRKYSYLDLVRTPKLRRMTMLTGCAWFAVAFTYYGIGLNITGFGVNIYLTQLIYGATELPAKIGIYFSLNKIGRQYSQVGSLLVTGVCLAVNVFVPFRMNLVRMTVAVMGKGFSEAAFTSIYLYTTELYPTVIRQNGLGFNSFVARVGVSLAPLVSLLEGVWEPLPNALFSAVALLAGLLALLLPETRNVRLPETIEDVEQTRKRSISTSEHWKDSESNPIN
ncbi:solute carrier family 22 member 7-like [Alosa sapidissima]|uniref:solute carrier family 22 member 7-like n=1 Tax=Alosa sapidissima TaxID=34773 RepID=UPI001C0A4789|nr:solute carrier family 22 member 7-like [Alosa sapidissima]